MEQVLIQAEPRDCTKGGTNALRRAGKIPGIIYGKEMAALGLIVDERAFVTTINKKGENVIFSLALGGQHYDALLREIQDDPLTGKIIHLDFYRILMDQEIETDVPLVCTGTAEGIMQGGVVEILMRSLRVKCLPKDLPAKIAIDITPLKIGVSFHVSDLKLPAGVTPAVDLTRTVVTLTVPSTAEVAAPAAAEGVEGEVAAEGAVEGAVPAEGDAATGKEGAAGAKGAPGAAPAKGAPGAAPAKGAPGAAPAKGAPGAAPAKGKK